ncbi:unnamed protein product [Caenorhabditis auriculariae]|uniref:Lipid-binding serum glycoprotein C-terminal domain-containing protein n=1 Tax=Caenorhabditis auriculariae TaxID=2777116 RepID=A0A8S1H9N3_9PELO|nr:unnamed protein product [Caenorhabditis auriculariae]
MRLHLLQLQVLVLQLLQLQASQFGVSFGDTSVSQLVRHVAAKFFENPRVAEVLLKTRDSPSFGNIAQLDLFSVVSYRNVSIRFHPNAVQIFFERLHVNSAANLSEVSWPIIFSDSYVNSHIKIDHGYLKLKLEENKMSLAKCSLYSPLVDLNFRDSWIINKGISAMSSVMSSLFESFICTLLDSSISDLKHSSERKFPVYDYLPKKVQDHMAARNTTLFYKLENIEASENQMSLRAQIEWQKQIIDDEASKLLTAESNSSLLEMQMTRDDVVTVWLEDAILNEILDQIDWNFEWMNEQIAVSSPIIPQDSREFLSTLCTECYFQVNVNAKGRPSIAATNESLVLTKTDRIHLQVVNPGKNTTSVFVSLILTIQAELRPTFDDGTLRTQVQLLDTVIVMEKGAFPKTWAFFMGDLIKGMIMDMLWPELKSTIEELSYGKGVKLSKNCGIDPHSIQIDIGEGSFSISTRLVLPLFNFDNCLADLRSSVPSNLKMFSQQN